MMDARLERMSRIQASRNLDGGAASTGAGRTATWPGAGGSRP